MYFTSVKIMIFMWQFGLVDTFTAIQFIYNVGAQYSSIVVAALAEGNMTTFPTMLFEPIAGLGVSYQIMRQVSSTLPDKPNITSHSFRIGYITQLWKDTQDIEFVKQTIGHRRLDTASAYVSQMTDQECQNRISDIDT